MKVWVDDREGQRVYEAHDYYDDVETRHLPTGDFIFDGKVAFEYKTLNDFIGSVRSRRVFKQVDRMKDEFPHHFVIIEMGEGLSKVDPYRMRLPNKMVVKKLFYGALASLNTVTKVIQARSMKDCFYMMEKVSGKLLDGNVHAKPKMKSTGNTAMNFLNYCVDGVGSKKAEMITRELELQTLNDLLSLNRDNLTSIRGIGDKMADKILKQIGV